MKKIHTKPLVKEYRSREMGRAGGDKENFLFILCISKLRKIFISTILLFLEKISTVIKYT